MLEAVCLGVGAGLLGCFLVWLFAGCDDFRKDVMFNIRLLFEKGYCADEVFDILKLYCDS